MKLSKDILKDRNSARKNLSKIDKKILARASCVYNVIVGCFKKNKEKTYVEFDTNEDIDADGDLRICYGSSCEIYTSVYDYSDSIPVRFLFLTDSQIRKIVTSEIDEDNKPVEYTPMSQKEVLALKNKHNQLFIYG